MSAYWVLSGPSTGPLYTEQDMCTCCCCCCCCCWCRSSLRTPQGCLPASIFSPTPQGGTQTPWAGGLGALGVLRPCFRWVCLFVEVNFLLSAWFFSYCTMAQGGTQASWTGGEGAVGVLRPCLRLMCMCGLKNMLDKSHDSTQCHSDAVGWWPRSAWCAAALLQVGAQHFSWCGACFQTHLAYLLTALCVAASDLLPLRAATPRRRSKHCCCQGQTQPYFSSWSAVKS
jgi:hypothetical protein